MKVSNRTTKYVLIAIVVAILLMIMKSPEKYSAGRGDYRYGFVDTNPARRVSDAFDSPNINDPYEGLPLP